jgi:predicted restriction endonuclease
MVIHGEKCCVCGLDFPPLLIGSHIKQWSKSNEQEKLDGNNGLLLCVMHDALFDRFLISFEDDGRIIYSDFLPQSLLEFLNLTEDIRINIFPLMKPYLQWHRDRLKRIDV